MPRFAFKFTGEYLPPCLPLWLGVASTCSIVAAHADELAPVKVARPIALPAPVTVGKLSAEAAAPVVTSNPLRAAAIAQLSAGTMSAQQLWDDGSLKAGDVLAILESPARLAPDERNEQLQGDLAGLLVRNAPETLKDAEKLPVLVRVALARYYSRSGDARTVALCEQLVGELDEKLAKNANAPQWPQLWAIPLLGVYYQNESQTQKEAQTWERGLAYNQNDAGWQASLRIEAARAYVRNDTTGNKQKANELYSQSVRYKDGFFSGLALWDQAGRLMGDGKYLQVQQLLLPTLDTDTQTLDSKATSQIYLDERGKLLVSSVLSFSYYKTHNFSAALKYAQSAILFYNSLASIPEVLGLESAVTSSYEIQQWIEQWRKSNIVIIPKQVILSRNVSEQDIKIRSFSKRELKVFAHDLRIEIVPKDDWREKEMGLYFEKTFTVRLSTINNQTNPPRLSQ